VFNVLLQVLGAVRPVTDGQAARWFHQTTVLIPHPANIGSASILDLAGDPARHGEMEEASERGPAALLSGRVLTPPGVDIRSFFHSLRADELRQIVVLQVERLRQRLEGRKLGLS